MTVDSAIKNRKTQKVLANEPWAIHLGQSEVTQLVNELLELAAFAPYHFKSHEYYTSKGELNSSLPYRFYILDSVNCRLTSRYIREQGIVAGKVKNMLDAADVLFLVTWLPESLDAEEMENKVPNEQREAVPFEGNLKNMEHIAAGAAAIQNVLLAATAKDIPTYWSSGGQLRNKRLRNYLGISLDEVLLGTIFLFPKDSEQRDATIKPGSLRDQGKEIPTWSQWIRLDEHAE